MNFFKSSFTSLLIFRSRIAGLLYCNNFAQQSIPPKAGPNRDLKVQVSSDDECRDADRKRRHDTTGDEENY
jgi:hypothetical protein